MSKRHIAGVALFFVIAMMSSIAYGDDSVIFGPQEMTVKKWHSHLSWHAFGRSAGINVYAQ